VRVSRASAGNEVSIVERRSKPVDDSLSNQGGLIACTKICGNWGYWLLAWLWRWWYYGPPKARHISHIPGDNHYHRHYSPLCRRCWKYLFPKSRLFFPSDSCRTTRESVRRCLAIGVSGICSQMVISLKEHLLDLCDHYHVLCEMQVSGYNFKEQILYLAFHWK
jgi:hypothetical protein